MLTILALVAANVFVADNFVSKGKCVYMLSLRLVLGIADLIGSSMLFMVLVLAWRIFTRVHGF